MEQSILAWITHYGYGAIFLLLALGIVGLPIPDETLMTFTGFLVFEHKLSLPLAFAAAWGGSTCGITISYWLGRRFGLKLIRRYGKYVRVTEEHVEKAHAWFDRVGHWGLTFGYFIPGIRHLSAYAAGMSNLEPRQFALFAYPGGALWVTTFLTLGYFLGNRWEAVSRQVEHYATDVMIVCAVGAVAYLVWRIWRKRRQRSA
jgi:membrane protein DedA with SNARE-associated domain